MIWLLEREVGASFLEAQQLTAACLMPTLRMLRDVRLQASPLVSPVGFLDLLLREYGVVEAARKCRGGL